jgi:predicted DNA-binding transcriptional regulator
MTLKQLKKLTKISERALRYYISDLLSKGFVKRKIVEAERLHYVYIANPADSVLDSIVKKIKERC